MPYTLDRHEDNALSVLTSGDDRDLILPTSWLPAGIQVGDRLHLEVTSEDDRVTHIRLELDKTAARERAERLGGIRASLTEGPEGNLEL